MVQTDISWLGTASLLLYNTAFIIPILAVLFMVYFGMKHKTISMFFANHMGLTKLALAFMFAVLAVLIWVF
jgi:cytochrome c biogenesis protein CcdA